MFRRPWRAILLASVGAWAALSPALAPDGGGSALAEGGCVPTDGNLDLNVAVGSESVKPGDVVTVTLDVSNLPSAINGAQALIRYDDSLLELTDVTTNAGPGWEPGFQDDSAGDITYMASIFLPGSTSTDGTVATLTFFVIAEGRTNLTFWTGALVSKLTRAVDSTTLLPCLGASGNIVSACDDGLFCNGLETFVAGACLAGTDQAVGTQCTDSAPGDCDDAQCDGAGSCVQDQGVEADTYECRPAVGVCDDAETCDGINGGTCGADAKVVDATPCGDATVDDCTDADRCNGVSNDCQANDQAVGTQCTDSTPGDCDDAQCDGAGSCVQNQDVETVAYECRPAVGVCDAVETCDGINGGACGVDAKVADATACGDATDDDCTNPDTCDGAGFCDPRDEAAGVNCAGNGVGECTDADTCDGSGVCLNNDLVNCPPPQGGGGNPGGVEPGCTDDADCDDQVPCTEDTCETDGNCSSVEVDCGPGLVCNIVTGVCDPLPDEEPVGDSVVVEVGENGETTVTVGNADDPALVVVLNGLDAEDDIAVSIDDDGNQSLTLRDADGGLILELGVNGFGSGSQFDVAIDEAGDLTMVLTDAFGESLTLEISSPTPGASVEVSRDAAGDLSILVTDGSGEAVDVTILAFGAGGDVAFSITFNPEPLPTTSRLIDGFPGFEDEITLGGSVTIDVTGQEPDATFTLLLGYKQADVESGDLDETGLRVRRLNQTLGEYEAAGTNDAGVGGATGAIGDFGVNLDTNSGWVELLEFGTFAVGIVPSGADDGLDDQPGQPLPPSDNVGSPSADCGAGGGMCGAFNTMILPLTLMSLLGMRGRRGDYVDRRRRRAVH
ncbi:MAG: hypothetical protein IID33_03865 [Planctomycetes bacterium]|nr:hypothetical protein [Planctomycetota bacterium]